MTALQDEAGAWLTREVECGRLTARQTEVARLLAAGNSVAEVAAALGICPATVGAVAGNIRVRLGLPPLRLPPRLATPSAPPKLRSRPPGELPAEAAGWVARHPDLPMLTDGQRAVVRRLAEGATVATVAAELGMPASTAYAYVSRSRTRIAVWERRNGRGG